MDYAVTSEPAIVPLSQSPAAPEKHCQRVNQESLCKSRSPAEKFQHTIEEKKKTQFRCIEKDK